MRPAAWNMLSGFSDVAQSSHCKAIKIGTANQLVDRQYLFTVQVNFEHKYLRLVL